MDNVSSVSPPTFRGGSLRDSGAAGVGQVTCLSGTLTRLLTLQVVGSPHILDVVLAGTGLGPVPLGSGLPHIRRALRSLVGRPVTACGTLRLGRGAHGLPLPFLDVVFVVPTSFGVPFTERRLLRHLLFLLLLNPDLPGATAALSLPGPSGAGMPPAFGSGDTTAS